MSPSPLFASGQVRPHRAAWRHTLLPLCLVGALGGSLGGGAYALWKAYQPERLALQERQPLQALHPWLPGATLSVPAPAGLWATQLRETALLLARAQPDGPPQTVSLCHQLSGGGGDALSLYPMALVAGLPKPGSADAATQRRLSRNPVVLPSALGEGLPRVWVQGRLAEGSTPAQLHLRVAAASGAPRTWQVGLARRLEASRADGAETYALGAETWLLWSPQPATAADAALDGTAARHAHGVRIRRVAQADCPSGALEWQLFDASANASAPRQAVLRALPLSGDALALRMSLPAGTYTVPHQPAPALEDRLLFEQALQAGLITPLPNGRLSVAPSDADGGAPPLLKPLYRTANGEHVRAQVRQANQFRHWLGVRLRAVGAGALPVSGQPADWRATAGGELLAVQTGLPDVATRLHSQPPEGWTPWQRVLAPQSWLNPVGAEAASAPVAATPEPVQLRLPLLPGQGGRFQVMVLGQVLAVQGARVLGNEAACTGPGCGQPDWLQTLTLEPLPNTQALVLTLVDQPQFNRLKPAAAEQLRVQWQGETLRWVDPPVGSPRPTAPAQVTLLARDGQALYDQGAPTALARQWGLAPLVGLAPAHGHSLAGVLARLGQQGHAQVQAVTTLEPQYQATLQAVLACIGQHDGQWQAAQQRCELGASVGQPADARRVSAAVLMDAHSGELLAVASGQALPADMATQELLAFDAFNPGSSPLRVAGLQHTGGIGQSPGSSFKLVDGLMLEAQARQAKPVRDLVEGLTAQALEARAKSAEQPFVMDSACYPAPCDPHRPHVQNFNEAPASRYVRDGHFGLKDALRNSVNTWFSWAVEQTDRTVKAGHADARPLGRSALEAERPLQAMMARLGMTEALHLDGDLLPETHAWQPGDVLQATPTTLDPLMDVHNIRQQALGLRMQTTPLHMARVAAAVATGRAPAVHLLHQLNGEAAHPAQPERLGLELGRLRAGMQEVVRAGTAQSAFASHALDAVRAQVYGKTGSAPLAGGGSKALCAAAATTGHLPLACLNNAWFVGYLAPGALPGEGRTLAFAVQVSFSAHTGGAQAAPVVAQWLQTLWAAQARGAASRP